MKKYFKNQRYDYSNAWRIRHVLPDKFLKEQVAIQIRQMPADGSGLIDYHPERRYKMARAVFMRFLELVVDDMIENNVNFSSPNIDAWQMRIRKQLPDSARIKFESAGLAYSKVNIFRSDGLIYGMILTSKHLKRDWQVRISHAKYMKIVGYVNEGKRYFDR